MPWSLWFSLPNFSPENQLPQRVQGQVRRYLRGIPNALNSDLHLSKIRIEWNRFYKPFEASGTTPTQTQLLQNATEIDAKYGTQFNPPR